MYGVSQVRVQPQLKMNQAQSLAFKGDEKGKFDDVVDLGKNVLDKATTKPDENTIKAGLAAVVTVVGLFLAKNAQKIKEFVDKGSKSSNKFVKAVAVMAGVMMSLLSIIGASTIFKDKVNKTEEKEAPVESKESEPTKTDADPIDKPAE
ncbi:MAG: hypothetical protein AB1782_08525 [Cyanobacteriota bacterium]